MLERSGASPSKWLRYRVGLYVSLHRDAEALSDLDAFVALTPCGGTAYSLRGTIHRRLRQYEAAVDDYTKAIACNDNERRAAWMYFHRGTPNWIRGEPELAAQDYAKAYELLTYPTYANARLYLVLRELGRTSQAESMLAEARQRPRLDPWIAKILACLAGDMSPDALVAAADTRHPQQICEAYYYAGEVSLLQGNQATARAWLQRCRDTGLVSDPNNITNPMSEYELAEWRLQRLIASAPDSE